MTLLLLALLNSALAQDACVPQQPGRVAREARELLLDGQYEEAVVAVKAAEENLACLDRLVQPEDLGALFQVGAKAAQEAGDETQARAWCASATRMAGTVPFDPSLGQRIVDLCADAGRMVDPSLGGTVKAWCPLRLDGIDLPAMEQRAVAMGRHLVQRVDPSGAVVSEWAEVRPRQVLEICSPPPVEPAPVTVRPGNRGLLLGGTGLAALGTGMLLWSALGPIPSPPRPRSAAMKTTGAVTP